jgi:lipoprotein-anchoring transpeptidase ErfK/SrfK
MNARLVVCYTVALAFTGFLTGCEEMETAGQTAANAVRAVIPLPTPAGHWYGDDVSGSPRIVVHLAEQKAYFYKGKNLVGESTVSTGKRGFGTPVGHYHVVSKDRDHVSSEFGDYVDDEGNIVKENIDVRKDSRPRGTHFDGARMPYCMHFNGGYAMHQGYVPPYAASHGCIRLPKEMAHYFFDAAHEGTPVIVKE